MNCIAYVLVALLEAMVCSGALSQEASRLSAQESPSAQGSGLSGPSVSTTPGAPGTGWGHMPKTSPSEVEPVQILSGEYFAIPGEEALPFPNASQAAVAGREIQQVIALQHYQRGLSSHWQWDTAFRRGELFTTHYERKGPEGSRLVWRELGRGLGKGQTLIIEGIGSAQATFVTRHGLRSQTHTLLASAPQAGDAGQASPTQYTQDLDSSGGALGGGTQGVRTLLEVLEDCRQSQSLPPTIRVLHPHTAQVETLRVRTILAPRLPIDHAAGWQAWSGWHASQGPLRYVRLDFLPSQTVSEYLFRGTELLSFRLHGQGPWAERISAQRWFRVEKEFRKSAEFADRSPRSRAMEAAAPFLDKRAHSSPQWYRDDGQLLDRSRLKSRPIRR